MDEIASKVKSSLTCSYCAKILKNPIELPCDDLICQEHLKEKEVVQTNKIKCATCKQEFHVKDNDFRTNKLAKKQIDDKIYLNEKELALRKKIEESIKKIHQMYEEFIELNPTIIKNKLDSDCFEHFHEIRFQIDQHREELKKKIDDIYMEMIEETKKVEATYLKYNEGLENYFKSFETRSIENDLLDLEVTFRNPNLLIESIQKIQQKQENEIRKMQFNTDEINQFKENLKESIKFKSNLSFNQDLFGQLYLVNDLLTSRILSGQQPSELLKLCEFNSKDGFKLLYRASEHGFGLNDFYSKCNGKENTLTILKAGVTSFIFGGFTTKSWDSSSHQYKSDSDAFLFSLTNKDNQPCKMKINSSQHQQAIYCYSGYGPSFGNDDICIKSNSNTNTDSYSNLGGTYTHPKYAYGTNEAQSFLAGSYRFQLSEIEVFQIFKNQTFSI